MDKYYLRQIAKLEAYKTMSKPPNNLEQRRNARSRKNTCTNEWKLVRSKLFEHEDERIVCNEGPTLYKKTNETYL